MYYSSLSGVSLQSNADSNSVVIPDNGGNANIPFVSTDSGISSINAVVPTSITIGSTTISDYTRKVPPINYILTVVSSQQYTPAASFTGTYLTGTRHLSVSFTDTSSNYPTSWLWNFGDGITSTQQNPTHTYIASGTYTVSLTASNGQGSNTMTRTS